MYFPDRPSLGSVISIPAPLTQDAAYRTQDFTALTALLVRSGVPHSGLVIETLNETLEGNFWSWVKLLSCSTNFGIAQALAAFLRYLGQPLESLDYLGTLIPFGSSGLSSIQQQLQTLGTLQDFTIILESLGYSNLDPWGVVQDPLTLTDWVQAQNPLYQPLAVALRTLDIHGFFQALIQLHFAQPLEIYSSLSQQIARLVFDLYSPAAQGSQADQLALGR